MQLSKLWCQKVCLVFAALPFFLTLLVQQPVSLCSSPVPTAASGSSFCHSSVVALSLHEARSPFVLHCRAYRVVDETDQDFMGSKLVVSFANPAKHYDTHAIRPQGTFNSNLNGVATKAAGQASPAGMAGNMLAQRSNLLPGKPGFGGRANPSQAFAAGMIPMFIVSTCLLGTVVACVSIRSSSVLYVAQCCLQQTLQCATPITKRTRSELHSK